MHNRVLSDATVGLPRTKASSLERGFRFSDNCLKKFKPCVNFTRIGLEVKEHAVVRLCKTVLSEATVVLTKTKASSLERGFRFSDNCMKKFKPRVNFTQIGLADKEYAKPFYQRP